MSQCVNPDSLITGTELANSLLVRDFSKVYRELRYTNEGSIRLSETEHNAYLNRLTIEVTHYDAYRARNWKTNPDNTHWGYLTALKGSSVVSNQPVKFAKQRVYENINQGIWEYHQNSENVDLSKSFSEQTSNAVIQSGVLPEAANKFVRFFLSGAEEVGEGFNSALDWLLGYSYGSSGQSGSEPDNYTALPVASPFPDVFKFKGDVPLSFLFRLESWYLVNPLVYLLSNPSDTGDATEGEDEYPSPVGPTGEGTGPGTPGNVPFPTPDLPEPGSNPEDYVDLGVDPQVMIKITYTVNAWQAGCAPYTDDREIVVLYEGSLDYSLESISTTNTSTCQQNPAPVGLQLVSPSGGLTVLESVGTEMRGDSTINSYAVVE